MGSAGFDRQSDKAAAALALDPHEHVAVAVLSGAGDLVVAVGHAAVANPEDVPGLVAGAKKAGHKNILVRVEREGNTRFVALPTETS